MRVKSILVSQPAPKTETSPYFDLANKQKIKVDFRSFIHVEGIPAREVRANKISLRDYTAIILTSRTAVDHFFRIAKEMRYEVPNELRYFCQSEAVAVYLQKYVVYRKRKIYYGDKTFSDLLKLVKKHKAEKFLMPCADKLKPTIPDQLNSLGIDWKRVDLYRTVISDLSDLEDVTYDILVFFSPSGIDSLFKNFPDFKQNKTRIAVYGATTAKAAKDKGLRVDISVPCPENPSMTMALEKYVAEVNKTK